MREENAGLRVEVVQGDITALEVDGIVNPANSLGEMGGGVAGVIRRKGGPKIEREAIARAPIPVGTAVATTAGTLPCRRVIHAPTMERPAMRTDAAKVLAAVRAFRPRRLRKVILVGFEPEMVAAFRKAAGSGV